MTWTIIITLILVGILLVLLEIFIIPGFVSGALGLISIIIGVYQAYKIYGATSGHITLSIAVLLVVLMLVLLFRSGTWRRVSLSEAIDGKANIVDEDKVKEGDIGTTVTRLNPVGKAIFDNNIFEVHSLLGIIKVKTEVLVTKIEGYKIYVKPLK